MLIYLYMKTAVIMVRQDMNGISISQNSKTGFFNANELIDSYNKQLGENKRMQHYLDNESTKRFLGALAQAENLNSRNTGELENGLMETKRGKYGGTWMHPYLFIDFAMWLSPEFKVTVIKWVYDNLIKLRNEAGDTFKEVNQALFESKPNSPPFVYSNEANMINKIVFGTPDSGQRNTATEEQLDLLKRLQKADIQLIKEGKDYYDRHIELNRLSKYL